MVEGEDGRGRGGRGRKGGERGKIDREREEGHDSQIQFPGKLTVNYELCN